MSVLSAALAKTAAETDKLDAVAFRARILMRKHGLDPARFGWDESRVRAGCAWPDGRLTLSPYLMALWPMGECEDTILHEIAHLLAPAGAKHGRAWQHICVAIGAVPEARYDGESLPAVPKRWTGTCPNGHRVRPRNRITARARQRICGTCYHADGSQHHFTWTRNEEAP